MSFEPIYETITRTFWEYGIRVVTKYADAIAERLEANDHKSGWWNMTPRALLKRAEQEMGELRRAIEKGESAERITQEAADVGNFLAFLREVYPEDSLGWGPEMTTWWCCTQCPCRVALGSETWKELHERRPVVHGGPTTWTLIESVPESIGEMLRKRLGLAPT